MNEEIKGLLALLIDEIRALRKDIALILPTSHEDHEYRYEQAIKALINGNKKPLEKFFKEKRYVQR